MWKVERESDRLSAAISFFEYQTRNRKYLKRNTWFLERKHRFIICHKYFFLSPQEDFRDDRIQQSIFLWVGEWFKSWTLQLFWIFKQIVKKMKKSVKETQTAAFVQQKDTHQAVEGCCCGWWV